MSAPASIPFKLTVLFTNWPLGFLNNSPSTLWVKSLTESGQFIEPVIMNNWQEQDGTNSLKIIDIKKTKKFLYIFNYNHKTRKQTIKEIPIK
jgi:hypothetical protein